MNHEIKDWSDIEHEYKNGSLLLGNGASIAISNQFSYKNLYNHAKENNLLDGKAQALFESFGTTDFEYVLRKLWQASLVNKALGIEASAANDVYQKVRKSLFNAILKIHPKKKEILDSDISNISKFLLQFNTVLSLNYDLIVYWAMMHIKDNEKQQMKDGFIHKGKFEENYKFLRINQYNSELRDTLVFYPHGNLILTRLSDCDCTEKKLAKQDIQKVISDDRELSFGDGIFVEYDLLKSIALYYQQENLETPLFVIEGTAVHKEASIKSNRYLDFVSNTVIKTDLGEFLTVYGWSFGEHDGHILKNMVQDDKTSTLKKIAVSVYEENQEFCNHVNQKIKHIFKDSEVHIDFFKSDSNNCWNKSESTVCLEPEEV